MDLQEAFDAGFAAVKKYVTDMEAGFEKRLVALESRQVEKGAPGKDGPSLEEVLAAAQPAIERAIAAIPAAKDGRDADPDAISAAVLEKVMAVVSQIPPAKDGPTLEEVVAAVQPGIERAVAAIPVPKDGRDADAGAITAAVIEKVMAEVANIPPGKDGAPGAPGADGKDADPAVTAQLVAEAVEKAVAALPRPADGKSVTLDDVGPFLLEAVSKAVCALPPPKDGVGVAGAVIDREGALQLTLSDGTHKELGRVVGKDGLDGQPGKAGRDGLGFDDLAVEFDDERSFKFVMVRGEERVEFGPFKAAWPIYRGVYEAGRSYEKGDTVTWAGNLAVALKDTSEKPEASPDWKLAVRRGRDGKDGVMKAAPAPVTVKAG